MKDTSIKKLSEVYAQLKGDVELDRDKAALAIKDVLRAESSTSGLGKRKFDLYNYVEQFRPVLTGVFYDTDGTRVASDAHILVALNGEPDEETAGKIIAKSGEIIEGRYPNYKTLLPTDWKDREVVRITKEMRAGFSEFIKESRLEHKAQYGKGCKWDDSWKVAIKGVAFKAEFFSRLLEAMDELGTDEIWLSGKNAAAVKSDKGWALLMPLYDKPGEDANMYTMA